MQILIQSLIIVVLGTEIILAQTATEPKELIAIRESYQKACSTALSPIEKKYSDALKGMKERLTKAGNLEGALAVDTELKKLNASPMPGAVTGEESEAPVSVAGTMWKGLKKTPKIFGNTVEFMDGSFVKVHHDTGGKPWESWTWRADDKGRVYLKCGGDEAEGRFKITRGGTLAEFMWGGQKCEAELLKK